MVVISDALWRRRFGGAPDAIGRKLRIDNDWYTVVGVMPPDFRHPGRSLLTDVDMWAPAGYSASPVSDTPARGAYFLTGAIARLKPGIIDRRGAAAARRVRAAAERELPERLSRRAPRGRRRLIPLQRGSRRQRASPRC